MISLVMLLPFQRSFGQVCPVQGFPISVFRGKICLS